MDYTSKNHSKFLLIVHLIFVCKYRKELMLKFGNQIKCIMYDIAQHHDLEILEIETDKDHIHLLVKYNPTQSVLDVVRLLKQISTYRIWRQQDNAKYLREDFRKEKTFWSDGYFACSVGNVSQEAIRKYISSQG
jgi:putative transposase